MSHTAKQFIFNAEVKGESYKVLVTMPSNKYAQSAIEQGAYGMFEYFIDLSEYEARDILRAGTMESKDVKTHVAFQIIISKDDKVVYDSNDFCAYDNSGEDIYCENWGYDEPEYAYGWVDPAEEMASKWVDPDDERNYGGYRHSIKTRKEFI